MVWQSRGIRQWGSIIGIVVVLIALPVLGVMQLMKARKGNLQIAVSESRLRDGGVVAGTVTIHPRKNLSAQQLTIRIVCTERWEDVEYDSDGYERESTQSRQRHEQQVTLEQSLELTAGNDRVVPFRIQLPQSLPTLTQSRRRTTRRSSGSSQSGSRRTRQTGLNARLEGGLVANLDLEGLDLGSTFHLRR